MTISVLYECIGYLGSALVVVSMLMTSVKKLRIVNTIGSTIFTAYALLIHSYPTALMNTCLIIINVINLIKLNKASKTYNIIECFKDESIVQQYLRSNLADINKFFPEFTLESIEHNPAFLVFTGSTPIGIAVGRMTDEKTFAIELDYTIPTYRDFSVATFLHKYLSEEKGINKLVFEGKLNQDNNYLKQMKFEIIDGVNQKSI